MSETLYVIRDGSGARLGDARASSADAALDLFARFAFGLADRHAMHAYGNGHEMNDVRAEAVPT